MTQNLIKESNTFPLNLKQKISLTVCWAAKLSELFLYWTLSVSLMCRLIIPINANTLYSIFITYWNDTIMKNSSNHNNYTNDQPFTISLVMWNSFIIVGWWREKLKLKLKHVNIMPYFVVVEKIYGCHACEPRCSCFQLDMSEWNEAITF